MPLKAAEKKEAPPPPPRPPPYSYVEGNEYDDVYEEIEAMGGDPFFLDDTSPEDGEHDEVKDTDPDFEWDGAVDEDAHFDFD